MIITMSLDTFNQIDDKKVIMENGQEVWICNYNNSHTPLPSAPQHPVEMTDLRGEISGNSYLKNGYKRPYTVNFTNKNGNIINWEEINFKWNIVNNPGFTINPHENKMELFLDNEDLIGSSFLLQIIIVDKVLTEFEITIIE